VKPKRQAWNAVLTAGESGAAPEWIQLLAVGVWAHPQVAGEVMRVTVADIQCAVDYFGAHATDIVVDYHHQTVYAGQGKDIRAEAAGWIQEMEARNEGLELWGRVLWTVEAARAVAAQEYRYLSPVLLWGSQDSITMQPVPMMIHSVALTNTPHLTELAALNERLAEALIKPDEGRAQNKETTVSLIEALAAALGMTAADISGKLSVEDGADDAAVAAAILGLTVVEEPAPPAAVNAAVADLLGVKPDDDEATVKAAILTIQSKADVSSVCAALGLKADADAASIVQAVQTLSGKAVAANAEALIGSAVADGKITPALKPFWLQAATSDLPAATAAINAMQVQAPVNPDAGVGKAPDVGGARALSPVEQDVCRMTGLSADEFRAQIKGA